ncbi:MAG: transcriptional repressor LexA [Treponema sp.]|jgi:repressor LexA|nr:transcriptional repressor LexA [Treponema sp.]
MKELTIRQREVLDFITGYIKTHTYSPAIRDIAVHFGMTPKGAHDHVTALKRKGVLKNDSSYPRTIEISDDSHPLAFTDVPILGSIAAGAPIFAEENYDGVLTMHRSMLRKGRDYFALRIRGDSMEGAGIFEDDIAVIEQCDTVNNGDIAAVQVDEAGGATATIKRFFRESNRICLLSENPKYPPLYFYQEGNQDVHILGRLSTVIRSY